ncbi:YncE family protein [Saccharothrix deserti]|uniref:YncE family protein n=1 Tax=Saccharothrix deserti TaxID=2593674 RepID=UPI00131C7172|nr:hypothetical protein [Saccharothrix deserti]
MPTVATAAGWPTNISVGRNPISVAISPNGTLAYVTNAYDRTVSVIDTTSKTVTGTINVGTQPQGIAFTPDSRTAYITNAGDHNTDQGSVSVINTATKEVTGTVSVTPLRSPQAVAVTPDGKRAYVIGYGYLSVIDTATNIASPIYIGNNGPQT